MDTYHQGSKQAATPAATNAGTPGAVHVDASSMKGHQAFQNANALTGGPKYYPEDQDTKPAATSIATNTSTPGAVHVDASSVQGHSMAAVPMTDEQIKRSAARKERIVSKNTPSRSMDAAVPMADEQLKRAATSVPTNTSTPGAVHVDASSVQGHSMAAVPMTDEQIKRSAARKKRIISKTTASRSNMDTVPMTDEQLKRSAARKDQIVSKTTPSRSNMDTAPMTDEQLKRSAARKDRIASRSSLSEDTKQEVEHDQDVENVMPGAVQVSGMDSMDSTTDDQNDTLTMADEDVYSTGDGDKKDGLNIESKHNSTFGGATDLQQKTSAVPSIATTIVEAQLVEENERELLEEEFRQKILDEQMGQVAQAEVVEDDGSKTRRRPLRWACSMVILLAIILGSVLGTRDTSSNAVPVLIAPLNNSLCGEALPIMLGGGAIEDSLENAIEQVVTFCDFPNQPSDSQRGLWFKVRG